MFLYYLSGNVYGYLDPLSPLPQGESGLHE